MIDPNVRRHFPALQRTVDGRPVIYFDNPAGTQVPQAAIDGYVRYFKEANANVGGSFLTSRATDEIVAGARQAMADFLGAPSPREIVFGQNMTSLTYHVAEALARILRPGDQIVATRLEHDANVSPWLSLMDFGVDLRWIDIHPEDATLDLESAEEVITERTRLLTVGLASNAFGTVNDVRRLADLAHARGAWVFVDAVHYAPHGAIDVQELGADLLVCSAYKFFGPHLGILWGRLEALETIPSQHVRPAGDEPPNSWETGTQSHEALSSLLGTMSYLRSLGQGDTQWEQLRSAMERIHRHERSLSERLIAGIQSVPEVRVYGITDPSRFDRRVPTVSFTIGDHSPQDVARRLGERNIFSWAGSHYALEPMGRLGLEATQRVGLVHYNTPEEIDTLVAALEDITQGARAGI